VSGRIVLRLDRGLGWTAPVFVAGCRTCGAELARSTSQAVAERTAGRTRCPVCGTRTARRLPGTTARPPTSHWPGAAGSCPAVPAGRLPANRPPLPTRGKEVSFPCLHPRPG
jgi:hypothetical protein